MPRRSALEHHSRPVRAPRSRHLSRRQQPHRSALVDLVQRRCRPSPRARPSRRRSATAVAHARPCAQTGRRERERTLRRSRSAREAPARLGVRASSSINRSSQLGWTSRPSSQHPPRRGRSGGRRCRPAPSGALIELAAASRRQIGSATEAAARRSNSPSRQSRVLVPRARRRGAHGERGSSAGVGERVDPGVARRAAGSRHETKRRIRSGVKWGARDDLVAPWARRSAAA